MKKNIPKPINKKRWQEAELVYKDFYKMRLNSSYIANLSVGVSTIRAFGKKELKKAMKIKDDDYHPLALYRSWAKLRAEEIVNNMADKDFDFVYEHTIKHLKTYWRRKTGVALTNEFEYYAFKLANLFFKFFPLHKDLTKKQRKKFQRNAPIPLDKFVYIALEKHSEEFNEYFKGTKTMGNYPKDFYNSFSDWHYDCHAMIREIIRGHGGPQIIFDFYSWNLKEK